MISLLEASRANWTRCHATQSANILRPYDAVNTRGGRQKVYRRMSEAFRCRVSSVDPRFQTSAESSNQEADAEVSLEWSANNYVQIGDAVEIAETGNQYDVLYRHSDRADALRVVLMCRRIEGLVIVP